MLASWPRSSRRLRLNSVSKHYHLHTIAPRNARSMRAEPRNLPKRCGVERHRECRRPTEARTSAPHCMRPALGLKSLSPEARDRAPSVEPAITPAASRFHHCRHGSVPKRGLLSSDSAYRTWISNAGYDGSSRGHHTQVATIKLKDTTDAPGRLVIAKVVTKDARKRGSVFRRDLISSQLVTI